MRFANDFEPEGMGLRLKVPGVKSARWGLRLASEASGLIKVIARNLVH